jgi:hypothetical protein
LRDDGDGIRIVIGSSFAGRQVLFLPHRAGCSRQPNGRSSRDFSSRI